MQQLLTVTTYKAARNIVSFCYKINDGFILQISFKALHKTLFVMLFIRQAT